MLPLSLISSEAEEKEMEERKASGCSQLSSSVEKAMKDDDVEDLGKDEPSEMITREQRNILLKQGYGVVGSHR